MRFSGFALTACLALCICSPARGQYSPAIGAAVARQYAGDQVALSPDGSRLAYTEYANLKLSLVVMDLERRTLRRAELMTNRDGREPEARLLALRWAGNDRIILQNAAFGIFAFDAGSGKMLKLWDASETGVASPGIRETHVYKFPPLLLPRDGGVPGRVLVETRYAYSLNQFLFFGYGVDLLRNLFSIDIDTGDSGPGFGELLRAGHRFFESFSFLHDRQGRWRMVLIPEGSLDPVYPGPEPLTQDSYSLQASGHGRWYYSYAAPGEMIRPNLARPTPLDRALRTTGPAEFEVTPGNYFSERSIPIGFGYDPEVIYFASNKGRDLFGLHSVNVRTAERSTLFEGVEGPGLAPYSSDFLDTDLLVFDHDRQKLAGFRTSRQGPVRWIDADLAEAERRIAAKTPEAETQLLQWDRERKRFLALVRPDGGPGFFATYLRESDQFDRRLERAPGLAEAPVETRAASFASTQGIQLTGVLTAPKGKPSPPLVIFCRADPWIDGDDSLAPIAELLTRSGVAVLQLNLRGSAVAGKAALGAFRADPDSAVADLEAAVGWITRNTAVDPSRIAIAGEGLGGFVVLRALELKPALFRCGIAWNAPADLGRWMDVPERIAPDLSTPYRYATDFIEIRALQLGTIRVGMFASAKPKPTRQVTRPLLVIQNPENRNATTSASRRLVSASRTTPESMLVEINWDFENGVPDARTKLFDQVGDFLNQNLIR